MNDRTDGDHSRILHEVLVPPVGTFELDRVHTFGSFNAQHLVVGRVRGRFEAAQGAIVVAGDMTQSSIEVSIETASITTLNPMREEDVLSESYPGVGQYPSITYRSTVTTESTTGVRRVAGDLTLHGVTRPAEPMLRFGGGVTDA